jgi:hypothetical protein
MDVLVSFCTSGGLLGGVNNASGGIGPPTNNLNAPIVQKSSFRNVYFSGITGGPTFKITAETYNGIQQVSGNNTFFNIRSESCAQDTCWLEWGTNPSTLIALASEDHPDTDDTYSFLKVKNGTTLFASDLQPGISGSANKYKYLLENDGGTLRVTNTALGDYAATKQVTTNTSISLINCNVIMLSEIEFQNGFPDFGWSTLINIRDLAGRPLAWPKDYPNLSLSPYNYGGVQLAQSWTGGNWHVPFSLLLTNEWVNGETYGGVGPILLWQKCATAPTSNPAAGYVIMYVDPADTLLKSRDENGNIKVFGFVPAESPLNLIADGTDPSQFALRKSDDTFWGGLRADATSLGIFSYAAPNGTGSGLTPLIGTHDEGGFFVHPGTQRANFGFAIDEADAYGSGDGVLAIREAATAPSTTPTTSSGRLYVIGGALFYHGAAGTITPLAPS